MLRLAMARRRRPGHMRRGRRADSRSRSPASAARRPTAASRRSPRPAEARGRRRRRSGSRSPPSGSRSSIWPAATPAGRRAARRDIRAGPRPGSRGTGSPAPAAERRIATAARYAVSINRVAATSSLSAIGSRKRPSSDCCCPAPRHMAVEPIGDAGRREQRAGKPARVIARHVEASRPPPGSPGCATASADWAGWSAARFPPGRRTARGTRPAS